MKAPSRLIGHCHHRHNTAGDRQISTAPALLRIRRCGSAAWWRPRRRGAAAVELAIVLPLLILLFLGACDFGRFAHTQVAVSNAARAGAGQASRSRPTAASRAQWEVEIRRAVRGELETITGFEPNRLTVSINAIAESGGTSRASIQVSYPFRTLIRWGAIPDLFTFRETVVFRIMQV